MNLFRLALCLLCVGAMSISCKSDNKKEENPSEINAPAEESQVAIKDDLNKDNLLVKTMSTPEAKTFTSALVTTGITDLLNESGPYTVFAPSANAFKALSKSELAYYLNPENKEAFAQLIKNHIVEVDLGSSDLLQAVRNDKNYELTSLGGAKLKVSMKDGNLFLTDEKGNQAALGKTDILATNGKLHIMERVLNVAVK
ncbi:MAG: fasciclin domain-containing protein [Flavobacteriaceae bacterium]|nr:fasciclin domain-containing protein [Flavobacteriaceae bacterium]